MIADFTVAGESHTDHKDQWKDCENHNTKNRKCQQGPMQSLVNECFQILFDGVDMFPFLCTALYLVSALHIDTDLGCARYLPELYFWYDSCDCHQP